MQTQNIIENLNTVFDKLFKSVEGQVYEIIDSLVVIEPKIFNIAPLKNICDLNQTNGIIIIANSLIILYAIFFAVNQIYNIYTGNSLGNVYIFILKMIVIVIITNFSYYICKEIINLFYLFSETINEYCKDITKADVTFCELKNVIMSIDNILDDDLLSVNGMIKGMISFGSITILFNMAIRYVTILFLIIFSPFAFISLSSNLTCGIFYSWIKIFITNLSIQIILKFIVLIPMVCKGMDDIMYKIILVGSLYIIHSINNFANQIVENMARPNKISGER